MKEMHNADDVLAELAAHLDWHEFRPWCGGYKEPPPELVSPCGDCGREESAHPIPRLGVSWATSEAVGRMIAAAAHIDGNVCESRKDVDYELPEEFKPYFE